MNSKDIIMQNLRKANVEAEARPQVDKLDAITYPDKLSRFKDALNAAATAVIELQPGDDLNAAVKSAYPNAANIVSNLDEISCATLNPDSLEDARKLDGTDVAVVRGDFGVLENGMVWVPLKTRHKAILFIAENLVILLDKKRLVNNMHEAYREPGFDQYDYGCFIAGPSKTADIEQALVVGAHGARAVTVILT